MPTIDDFITYLNNSLAGDEVPIAVSVAGTDWVVFWSTANDRFERIARTDFGDSAIAIDPQFLGTVTTAGTTTTDTEIQNFVNAQGFIVASSSIVVLEMGIYIDSMVYTARYFYKPNASGSYGTAAANEIAFSDLYRFSIDLFNLDVEEPQVIDLGDIGASTIHDHINALVGTTYNLTIGNVYQFKCVISAVAYDYLWVGALPITIGDGGTPVTADDFYELTDAADTSLQIANNLSDVQDASISRTNLGVAIGTDVEKYLGVVAAQTLNTSYNLDHNNKFWNLITMDGATTFADTNLVVDGVTRGMYLTGNFVPTLPSYWTPDETADTYDGTKICRLTWDVLDATPASEDVRYNLEIITA